MFINACTKKADTLNNPSHPYTTSTGGSLTDSTTGELGDTSASVIYGVKGIGHGLSFKCYDQSVITADTNYANIVVYFALTKADLAAGNYLQTLKPAKDSNISHNFGRKDSLYIKVVKNGYASLNNQTGKFNIKVVQNTMLIESAESLVIHNDSVYTKVSYAVKGISKSYEKWYKVTVTPGKTYYIHNQTANDVAQGTYDLTHFNCNFYDTDGITNLATNASIIDTWTTKYVVPLNGGTTLYIACLSAYTGTNGIRVSDL
jgi:hypothetical protein